ncbi:MAG TPA: DUF2786 domain-containing protein [Polyangiaceae bacterium]
MPEAEPISVELERAALRALSTSYDDLNWSLFRSTLRRPGFAWTKEQGPLGRWTASARLLELSRVLLLEHGWGALIEVLKHEMAHQYVDEVLACRDQSAHGPAFQRVCSERGIDPAASGIPRRIFADTKEAKVLERIAKLLALAESSNENEAQTAMSAAQRLMLKYNLAEAARQAPRRYGFKHLGKPNGRLPEHERILAGLLGDYFFVQVIWVPVWRPLDGKRGSVLEICGTPENLEIAEYVHTFLLHSAEQLWREHKRRHGIARNSERRAFLSGVMTGFQNKLARDARRHEKEGLIWVGDSELADYLKLRHPRIRWTTYGSARRGEAFAYGQEAGKRLVIHRGVKSGPGDGPKLLGPPP